MVGMQGRCHQGQDFVALVLGQENHVYLGVYHHSIQMLYNLGGHQNALYRLTT